MRVTQYNIVMSSSSRAFPGESNAACFSLAALDEQEIIG
jgi:hypothetical protein